jgi:hypothetical protein
LTHSPGEVELQYQNSPEPDARMFSLSEIKPKWNETGCSATAAVPARGGTIDK